ncbi:MAG TPA: hypothetical protein VL547_04205 [Dinghuibacter sp.]|uniref:hypothetical protein n=1 Tax=Dinghuibacter sp. TaxID=2024697 RepID=UPI002D18F83D|nr:hypothetical protein [Dinghuibacter sp.]HTJ11196.1 hypothetical protein [Dinghuibacter sp.]
MRGLLLLLGILTIAQTHRPVPRAPRSFELHGNGKTQVLLYSSSQRLGKKDTGIHTLLIVIHGLYGNGPAIFDHADDMVHHMREQRHTLVIAPQYATLEDKAFFFLGDDYLVWKNAGWRDGNEAESYPLSSYAVMDSLIGSVMDGPNFPNIKNVVVMGHSAGGQFVQRYSVTTPLPDGHPAVAFRFIVMNPSSYLYPDANRPLDGVHFVRPDSTSCPSYNRYPKGLEGLNHYARLAGRERILYNMRHRDIVILLGEDDTDPGGENLDVTCAGEMEGAFRLQRGKLYAAYMGQPCEVVPRSGHNSDDMINSAAAERWVFGKR